MRTTNKLKDGTKKRITYYACGNWKNKGIAVCNSNAIRVDKANEYVFGKIEELLSNEKMVKEIIDNINHTRRSNVEPNKKKLDKIDKELSKLKSKKTKILEAYEDDLITKEELVERKSELDKNINVLEEEREKILITVTDENQSEVSYDVIKEILQSFGRIMVNYTSKEKQKMLLHRLVSKITVGKDRKIDSIKLKINDGLIDYLSNEEEVPMKDVSYFLMRNFRFGRMKLNLAI